MAEKLLLRGPQPGSYSKASDLLTSRSSLFFLQTKTGQQTSKPVLNIQHVHRVTQQPSNTGRTLLFFHGNGEDLGISFQFLTDLSDNLECNIYAMEYPGYGMYPWTSQENAKSQLMREDAIELYRFITQSKKVNPRDLIIMGRSMGSGPSSYLAQQTTDPKMLSRNNLLEWKGILVLLSPYASIERAFRTHSPVLGFFFGKCISNFFNNKECLNKFKLPTLFIHGKKDDLIIYTHSEELRSVLSNGQTTRTHYPKEMTHNYFDMTLDVINPIKSHIDQYLGRQQQIQVIASPKNHQNIRPQTNIINSHSGYQ